MTEQTNTNPPVENTGATVVFDKVKQREKLRELLYENKPFIKNALPKNIPVDRMIQVVMLAVSKEPKLLMCTFSSIVGSIMQSCQLGLLPDGITGEAYFIPYNVTRKTKSGERFKQWECQFIPGYRGLITLGYRSGMVKSFNAYAVYEGDKFEYAFGLNEKCIHIPADTPNNEPGKLTHAYAVIKTTTGGEIFDVMTRKQIDAIRMISKAPNSDAWVKAFPEMAIKTVIRKIAKRCPLSSEFNTAVALDETVELLGQSQNNSLLLIPDAYAPQHAVVQPTPDVELEQIAQNEFENLDMENVGGISDTDGVDEPPVEPSTPQHKKAAGAVQQTIDSMLKKADEIRAKKPGAIPPNPATNISENGQ